MLNVKINGLIHLRALYIHFNNVVIH